jgi:hypothetical protein
MDIICRKNCFLCIKMNICLQMCIENGLSQSLSSFPYSYILLIYNYHCI